MTNLEDLFLNRNELSGPLPLTLSALSQLLVLDIRETTLCAPVNTAFQAWLATIDFKGTVCAPPPPPPPPGPRRTVPDAPTNLLADATGDGQVDADLGCAGRRRRRGDHGLRVPDRPAGRLDFHRFHRTPPIRLRWPRQRHDLRLSGAGAQPDRQEWSFPAGRGGANSAGGFRLGAFCQRGQHHLRSSACECGPPSDPARSLLLRSRRRADRSGIDGGCPGRSGDPRGRGADDPDGDGAAGRTHDLDPRPGRPGEWIGEGGRLWGHRRGPAF